MGNWAIPEKNKQTDGGGGREEGEAGVEDTEFLQYGGIEEIASRFSKG